MDVYYYEEEDSLSHASSVDFIYSEEEDDYYCSGDDIDEDDRDDGEVDMTNPTATEKNEEFISISDVALKYSMNLIPEDSSKPIFGWQSEDFAYTCRAEDTGKPALQDGTLKLSFPHLEQEDEAPPPRGEILDWLPFQDWVGSWKVKSYRNGFAWIHMYAYHSKDKSFGGYGVILRDLDAKPVTASAMFSAEGKSFFTQVLLGIKCWV
ncbi:hypothetical protein C5167_031723 [Papaver somniferum]|uniref:Uncharacterized protein n=1 Tax=Papaver somniferum TaxID=3469 RepID=A0A4Y7K936_PAPSO|nr:hypothetical protein C5167_031754 [Papaver somniferum]RZC68505.1 hypothetical protein C5167_031755 [Papaver somniferum]RZC68507.1 hypothetical protein C5167_031723 [Papaver somniferum]